MDHVPSYKQMKHYISNITGVSSVVHPMCKNSCLAFTGPFANLNHCPKCKEPKLCPNTKRPQQELHTILLGLVLQALWCDASSAKKFYYQQWKTWEIICKLQTNSGNLSSYDNFYSSSDYLENIRSGKFKIMILFLCSQLTVPSSMHTNHWTAGFTYGLSWTSHPMNNIKNGTFFLVGLSLVQINQRISTCFYSQGCIMSACSRVRVYIFGTLFRTKGLSHNCFLHLTWQMDLQWPT